MIWPVPLNLGFCPQIWVFNAFLDFSSEDLGILGFNWVALIQDRVCFIILLISSLIFFYLFLSRHLSLQHN